MTGVSLAKSHSTWPCTAQASQLYVSPCHEEAVALGPEEKKYKVGAMGPAANEGWHVRRTKLAGSFESLAGEPPPRITARLTEVPRPELGQGRWLWCHDVSRVSRKIGHDKTKHGMKVAIHADVTNQKLFQNDKCYSWPSQWFQGKHGVSTDWYVCEEKRGINLIFIWWLLRKVEKTQRLKVDSEWRADSCEQMKCMALPRWKTLFDEQKVMFRMKCIITKGPFRGSLKWDIHISIWLSCIAQICQRYLTICFFKNTLDLDFQSLKNWHIFWEVHQRLKSFYIWLLWTKKHCFCTDKYLFWDSLVKIKKQLF